MSSAPLLHTGNRRLSAVEACRLLAGEVWKRDRKLENFRAGGLNSEKAVRQRLQSFAMEMQRLPGLDEKVALHLYSIDWSNADPLTILERSEGLVDRQCRENYASIDALLRERDRATELAVRLLVLQGLAGRIGRWAVRAGEIPDARIARGRYRELGAPEWSQYCKLNDEANAAFERGDYALAAARAFDADRLVRTPASLLMAAVSMSRINDYVAALWAIRVCLLEPEESFESEVAHKKARTLDARLREIVEGRGEAPSSGSDVVSVDSLDVIDEKKDILETQPAKLQGRAAPPPAKADAWGERYFSSDSERAAPVADEQRVLVTPKPVVIEKPRPTPYNRRTAETRKGVVTMHHAAPPEEQRIPTRPSSPEHLRLIERERVMNEVSVFDPPQPCTELETAKRAGSILESDSLQRLVAETWDLAAGVEEDMFVPAGPSEDVSIKDFHDETEIPPDPQLRRMRELAMARAISAAAGLELDDLTIPPALPRQPSQTTDRIPRKIISANRPEEPTDLLGTLTLPMGQHTRETALAGLDREESLVEPEAVTSQLAAESPAKVVLKRVYEVTQVVRARGQDPERTDHLVSRSPLKRQGSRT